MAWYSLDEVAAEVGASCRDVFVVAEAELTEDHLYDPVEERVSDEGRALLVAHFRGGWDPAGRPE